MPNETLSQRWEDYRPTKTQTFWIAAGAVALTLIAGFGFGDWKTGTRADQMVADAATQARQQLAAAVCVDHFMKAADAGKRLDALRNETVYRRGDFIAEKGWATMPDRKEPNGAVAYMCAERLGSLKPPPV
jgi:hypothetical protein